MSEQDSVFQIDSFENDAFQEKEESSILIPSRSMGIGMGMGFKGD